MQNYKLSLFSKVCIQSYLPEFLQYSLLHSFINKQLSDILHHIINNGQVKFRLQEISGPHFLTCIYTFKLIQIKQLNWTRRVKSGAKPRFLAYSKQTGVAS